MQRGEIWHVNLDEEDTEGHEQKGRRYCLVVTTREFNSATGIAWVCPITTGGARVRGEGLTVSLHGVGKVGGVVLCFQLRALDLKARKGQKVEKIPDEVMQLVLDTLSDIIEG